MGKRLSGLALALAVMILTGYVAAEATAIITAPTPGDLTPLLVGGLGLAAVAFMLQWDPIVDRVPILQPVRRKVSKAQAEAIILRSQMLKAGPIPPERASWGESEWRAALTGWVVQTSRMLQHAAKDLEPWFRLESPRTYQYQDHPLWASDMATSFDWRLERLAEIQRAL